MGIIKNIFSNPWKNTSIQMDYDLENIKRAIDKAQAKLISIQKKYDQEYYPLDNRESEKRLLEYQGVLNELSKILQVYANELRDSKMTREKFARWGKI